MVSIKPLWHGLFRHTQSFHESMPAPSSKAWQLQLAQNQRSKEAQRTRLFNYLHFIKEEENAVHKMWLIFVDKS